VNPEARPATRIPRCATDFRETFRGCDERRRNGRADCCVHIFGRPTPLARSSLVAQAGSRLHRGAGHRLENAYASAKALTRSPRRPGSLWTTTPIEGSNTSFFSNLSGYDGNDKARPARSWKPKHDAGAGTVAGIRTNPSNGSRGASMLTTDLSVAVDSFTKRFQDASIHKSGSFRDLSQACTSSRTGDRGRSCLR